MKVAYGQGIDILPCFYEPSVLNVGPWACEICCVHRQWIRGLRHFPSFLQCNKHCWLGLGHRYKFFEFFLLEQEVPVFLIQAPYVAQRCGTVRQALDRSKIYNQYHVLESPSCSLLEKMMSECFRNPRLEIAVSQSLCRAIGIDDTIAGRSPSTKATRQPYFFAFLAVRCFAIEALER